MTQRLTLKGRPHIQPFVKFSFKSKQGHQILLYNWSNGVTIKGTFDLATTHLVYYSTGSPVLL